MRVFRFFKLMRASRTFGRGSRLLRRKDFAGARDHFVEALRLVGTERPGPVNMGVWFSVRFQSLRSLARCAAKLNDVPLARSSIEEALSLWQSENIGPAGNFAGLPEWMRWANDYVARSGKPEELQ
jgi:hypothetical protein